jgi:hypothetical protein
MLDVLVQAPHPVPVTVTPTVPAGWTVSPAPRHGPTLIVATNGLPTQKTVAVTVTPPAGTPVGSYPVHLSIAAAGGNTVVTDSVIELRAPAVCAAAVSGACAVDLTADRNHDGTATVAQSDQGNFDGGGWSYDADLLPAPGPVAGTTYLAPDPGGTALNFVQARGQTLLLPAGQYHEIRVVSAAHGGSTTAGLTVQYTDGSVGQVEIPIGDWAGGPPAGSSVVLAMPHRIRAGMGVDGPPVNLFGHVVAIDASRTVQSIALPADSRIEVYAVTLG